MRKVNFNIPVIGILNNPQKEWKRIRQLSRGNIRTAFRDLNVDWKKYNTKDYLFTHDSIVCSVETESNGYHITKPCEELVNANGNAWKNEVLLHCFRTFIGGDNFCFVKGTRVLMSDGTYKCIEEISIGDKVINAKGETDIVTDIFSHTYNGKMTTLQNSNILSKKVSCTSNHPFFVYDNKKCFKYIEASNMDMEKNSLVHPVPEKVIENDEINENRAYLIGWFLACGFYVNNTQGLSFIFPDDFHINKDYGIALILSNDKKDIAEKICKLLEYEFPEDIKCSVLKDTKDNIVIYFDSLKADEFFKKYCDEDSWNKRLSEDVMWLPLNLQKIILLQYMKGIGIERGLNKVTILSDTRKLIQQMRLIAIRLGIFPTYSEMEVIPKDCNSTDILTSEISILDFNYNDWCSLNNEDESNYKSDSIKIGNNFIFGFEKEETETNDMIVYNFETQNDHSYIVEGVAVHNCEHVQIPALSKGKILDAIIRPVVHHSKYGDANIYLVDILIATDRRHHELVSRIESGKLNTLSMGAVCEVCQCSICGKLIKDDDKNCEHLENYLGSYYKCEDGKKRIVAELCGALDENGNYIENSCNFIEASWVEHPAFEGAVVNAFIETEEEKIAREKSQKELEDLFNGNLFDRLKVADTDSKIALNILKDYKRAEKYLNIAKRIVNDNI